MNTFGKIIILCSASVFALSSACLRTDTTVQQSDQTSYASLGLGRRSVVTGHEAIPPNTIINSNFRSDGTGSPIYQYKQGYGSRIEFLEGIIKPGNIGQGSPCTDDTRSFIQRLSGGVTDDICGHIIANVLGGRGDLKYNVFPQNKHLNNRAWKSFEGRVKTFVRERPNSTANVRFWFDYDTAYATRPANFTVVANLLEGHEIVDGIVAFTVRNRETQ